MTCMQFISIVHEDERDREKRFHRRMEMSCGNERIFREDALNYCHKSVVISGCDNRKGE